MASACNARLIATATLLAASPGIVANELSVEQLVGGLSQPVAVAARTIAKGPSRELIVAEASGRLFVVDLAAPGTPPNELRIAEPQAPQPNGGASSPTCLRVLDSRTLVVGIVSPNDPDRSLLVLRQSPREAPGVMFARQRIGELLPDDAPKTPGRYAQIAANARYLFVAFQADGGGGRLLRARHTAGMLSALRPLATAEAAPSGATPTAVAVGERGYVAAVFEPPGESATSQLMFAAPEPGVGFTEPTLMDLELRGVRSIAYSPTPRPTERRLYALAGRSDDAPGGLFRIDAGVDANGTVVGQATRLLDIDQPADMAFGADATLYIARGGQDGELLKITGEL